MSILYPCYSNPVPYCEGNEEEQKKYQKRLERNIFEDMHQGIDLVREFKDKLNKFHPDATSYLIRMMQ